VRACLRFAASCVAMCVLCVAVFVSCVAVRVSCVAVCCSVLQCVYRALQCLYLVLQCVPHVAVFVFCDKKIHQDTHEIPRARECTQVCAYIYMCVCRLLSVALFMSIYVCV